MSSFKGVSKVGLECKSTKAFIVIRKNVKLDIKKLKEFCDTHFKMYAFIEHEKDISPDTGEVEGCHYHIVGDYVDSGVRFSRRLNDISNFFRFDNNFGIEITKYQDLSLCIQYLIHKNNKEKTPHKVEEIITNLGVEELNIFLSAEREQLITFEYIVSCCMQSRSKLELIKLMGLVAYEKHYKAINDIWSELVNAKSLRS